MKYSVDRLENNIAIIEDIESGIKKEVNSDLLPKEVKEGSIIVYKNNSYELDLTTEEIRRKRIKERFERLKK